MNTTVDFADIAPGNGLCEWNTISPPGERCTLRAAINEANALPGVDLIIIPEGFNIVLTRTGRGEDAGFLGDLDISESVIIGSLVTGALRPVIDANSIDRVFDVLNRTPSVNARFANMVIRGGLANQADGYSGGGIQATFAGNIEIWNTEILGNAANAGGGVWAKATSVNLDQTEIRSNVVADLGFTNIEAAGLYASGSSSVTITRSTVANNTALGAPPVRSGVWIEYTPVVRITNSTLSNNLPSNIYFSNSDFVLNNVTISGRGSSASQYGLRAFWPVGGSSTINNSIIDGHATADCNFSISGGVFSYNHNYTLASDTSCNLVIGAGNIQAVSAQLLGLAFNGGPTRTHFPTVFSPVVDRGSSASSGPSVCEPTDQRGYTRPQTILPTFPECDMGAVEADEIFFRNGFEPIIG